ncbi:hypothetical protein TNIN_361181 [Trichonephila inaurata madagascariensis]|uniref:Sulfotransferase domain-containing protein n=1 Tax=Trichonephila inaurata madagascariensis TaxID=2747483 RepID=A0A8X6WUA0_9ARAC|nr:hypothetical protein TNIN_361181 [Trichonephila inaurata madagascariensis]
MIYQLRAQGNWIGLLKSILFNRMKVEHKPLYTNIDGMTLAPFCVPEVHRAATEFKPGKDDVIVAAYPKCGCTFTLQIVSLILRKENR